MKKEPLKSLEIRVADELKIDDELFVKKNNTNHSGTHQQIF